MITKRQMRANLPSRQPSRRPGRTSRRAAISLQRRRLQMPAPAGGTGLGVSIVNAPNGDAATRRAATTPLPAGTPAIPATTGEARWADRHDSARRGEAG